MNVVLRIGILPGTAKNAFVPIGKKAVEESGMFRLRMNTLTVLGSDKFHVCKKCGIIMAKLPYIKEEQT